MRPVRTGRLHPTDEDVQTVDKRLIAQVLTKTCKIDAQALVDDNNASLETLYNRISAKIYGQNEAVKQVVEAVEMAKAGLQDDNKPLANLLFVGPTGVGKTEVARVLAKELGVSLVRFDMSEYTEKHTAAALSAHRQAMSATRMAACSPMPSARHQTVCCCSTR